MPACLVLDCQGHEGGDFCWKCSGSCVLCAWNEPGAWKVFSKESLSE